MFTTHTSFSLSLSHTQVQLTIMDVNDFRPRFSERVFSTSVFENEPVGTSVITLTATDLDEGENALLTYSLQGPGAGTTHHTHNKLDMDKKTIGGIIIFGYAFYLHLCTTLMYSYDVTSSLSVIDAFSLDPDTGLIRSLRLLQSFERFNLTVVATDHGRPPLWGTTSLQITVIDVNDNRPVFVRPANGTIMHILEVLEALFFITRVLCSSDNQTSVS